MAQEGLSGMLSGRAYTTGPSTTDTHRQHWRWRKWNRFRFRHYCQLRLLRTWFLHAGQPTDLRPEPGSAPIHSQVWTN